MTAQDKPIKDMTVAEVQAMLKDFSAREAAAVQFMERLGYEWNETSGEWGNDRVYAVGTGPGNRGLSGVSGSVERTDLGSIQRQMEQHFSLQLRCE